MSHPPTTLSTQSSEPVNSMSRERTRGSNSAEKSSGIDPPDTCNRKSAARMTIKEKPRPAHQAERMEHDGLPKAKK